MLDADSGAASDPGLAPGVDATAQHEIEARLASTSRLEAVQGLQMLDTPPEEMFDALTRLAATLLRAPACFLSLVDGERDFYKSQVGLPEPLSTQRQLSGRTFCHHTLARTAPLVINDTHADAVWRALPSVATLGVRAYVGAPLTVGGETVGSFCVIDHTPRDWSAAEIETVRQLALSANRELSLRGLLRDALADADRARVMAREKETLLASVVHDLGTPLHVMTMCLHILQRSANTEQRVLLERMLRSADSMKAMSAALLSPHTAVGAAPRHESVNVAKLMGDTVDVMHMIAARAEMSLTLGELPEANVVVDYAQMLRVFCNLVGNSVKYCPAGSTVRVFASRSQQQVQLCVADNGPGMSPAERQQAFEPGWQGPAGTRRADGAGLGLSIVRTLVEQNGGQVQLASEPGAGTTVTVRLACKD